MDKLLICCTLAFAGLAGYGAERIIIVGLFKDKAIVTIDGKRRVLAVGHTSPEGVKLIAADSREAVLEVGGQPATYKLATHISSNYSDVGPQPTVRVWPDASGMYLTYGSINEFPVEFLIDTGATLVSMNKVQAKRLGMNYKLDGAEGMTTTASGTAKAYYLSLEKVRVGDIVLRDVQAAVIDGEFPVQVLLGNSFLNRVRMTRAGQVLELQKK